MTRALAAGAATEQLQAIDGEYPAGSIHGAVIVTRDNRAAAAGDGGTMMMLRVCALVDDTKIGEAGRLTHTHGNSSCSPLTLFAPRYRSHKVTLRWGSAGVSAT